MGNLKVWPKILFGRLLKKKNDVLPPPNPGDEDERVKVSADDTDAEHLLNKLTAGTGITLTETNPGQKETITISSNDSAIDHGSLAGLADDDHTQYLRTDGTRACTGAQRFEVGIEIGKFDNVSCGILFNISGANVREFKWNNDTKDFRLDDGLRIVQLSGSSGPELDFVDNSGDIWTIVKDGTTGSFMIRDTTNDRHIVVMQSSANMILGTSTVSGAYLRMNTGIVDINERPYKAETPPSGEGRLYVVNGELFFKNDAGTETKLA